LHVAVRDDEIASQAAWSATGTASLALALQRFRGAAGTEYGLSPSD
jgi:hypothetical protein